jgi:(1->4)-alpha-D-glucan 1-alpha-D-glucosylmutase
MLIPLATYRVQFNPAFGFKAAKEIASYLSDLGVSSIYASPIFAARSGSQHGYDVVDPNQINPELGGEGGFEKLVAETGSQGLSWLQDIIPNHMAFDSQNPALMDVLEKGKSSSYFIFFDVNWDYHYEEMKGKILAPFLGKFYAEALENGELRLEYDENGLRICYHDLSFPLCSASYPRLFGKSKSELRALYSGDSKVKNFMDEKIRALNGQKGDAESFNDLDRLLSWQLFRLSFWKVAAEEINYRRFFNINQLISLRVEDKEVFESTHELIFRMVREEKFDGLRIDHVDGLYDPKVYLERLRERAGDVYLLVEKILDPEEELPSSWPVEGTTGYDFLNYVNGLFCRKESSKDFTKIFYKFTGLHSSYEDLVCEKKRLIIGKHMAGDVDNLAHALKAASREDRYGRDITLYGLKRALVEVLANFPVYRTYINKDLSSEADRNYVKVAIEKARGRNPGFVYEINYIEKFILQESSFAMRFQQCTAPLMAKGFEDTLLYIYNKLVSLNEVGGDPNRFGITLKEFHRFNARRNKTGLNATSTHDTKRGEDVRARINVLSELPREWKQNLKLWSQLNRAKKKISNKIYMPDENDEYLLYQTLIGAFPFREDNYQVFVERIKNYTIKAVREAKRHTAWIKPDIEYEEACISFVEKILNPSEDNRFLTEFKPFQKKIQFYGVFNSLSQTLLKITCPGVPDFYQGAELWDLNLVDPDNRRPVDFGKRKEFLREIKERGLDLLDDLLKNREDGRIKLFLICRALAARKEYLEVFEEGSYLPLRVEGRHKENIIAFARRRKNRWAIAIATRFLTRVVKEGDIPLGERVWGDTAVIFPEKAPNSWYDTITFKEKKRDGSLKVGEILSHFPVALLAGEKK